MRPPEVMLPRGGEAADDGEPSEPGRLPRVSERVASVLVDGEGNECAGFAGSGEEALERGQQGREPADDRASSEQRRPTGGIRSGSLRRADIRMLGGHR